MGGKEKRPFNWAGFLKKFAIRFPIFIIILGALLIVSLKLVVRHPESLRVGLEDYFSKATNSRASINAIDKIIFYPKMDIRLSDLSLHANSNAAKIYLEIETLEVSSPFWSLITPIKRFDHLLMTGASFEEGFVFNYPMFIERLEIIDKNGPDQHGSFLYATGTYADKEMILEVGIEKIKERYKLPNQMPFSLVIGDVSLNAMFVRNFSEQYFKNAVLKISDKQSEARDYDFFTDGEYQKDNPFNCMLDHIKKIDECNIYFERVEKD